MKKYMDNKFSNATQKWKIDSANSSQREYSFKSASGSDVDVLYYPENVDDNYFKNLSYQDVTVTDSYCNNVSGKMLSFLRFLGFSLSYITIYISRPIRIYNFLKNFFRKNFLASNLFEQRIYDYYVRLKLNRKKVNNDQ